MVNELANNSQTLASEKAEAAASAAANMANIAVAAKSTDIAALRAHIGHTATDAAAAASTVTSPFKPSTTIAATRSVADCDNFISTITRTDQEALCQPMKSFIQRKPSSKCPGRFRFCQP